MIWSGFLIVNIRPSSMFVIHSRWFVTFINVENSDEISLESEDEEEEGTEFKQKLLERLESATCQRQTR